MAAVAAAAAAASSAVTNVMHWSRMLSQKSIQLSVVQAVPPLPQTHLPNIPVAVSLEVQWCHEDDQLVFWGVGGVWGGSPPKATSLLISWLGNWTGSWSAAIVCATSFNTRSPMLDSMAAACVRSDASIRRHSFPNSVSACEPRPCARWNRSPNNVPHTRKLMAERLHSAEGCTKVATRVPTQQEAASSRSYCSGACTAAYLASGLRRESREKQSLPHP